MLTEIHNRTEGLDDPRTVIRVYRHPWTQIKNDEIWGMGRKFLAKAFTQTFSSNGLGTGNKHRLEKEGRQKEKGKGRRKGEGEGGKEEGRDLSVMLLVCHSSTWEAEVTLSCTSSLKPESTPYVREEGQRGKKNPCYVRDTKT